MDNETTETTDTTEDTTTAVPYADAEGKLREGWHGDDETLKRFTNVNDLSKSYLQVRKMVGTDMMTKPGDKYTEEDWNAFHEAGGRPATPADYGFARPEGMPDEYWSDSRMLDWSEFMHKIGLSATQAKQIFEKNNGEVILGDTANKQAREAEVMTAKDSLNQKWGAAYESKLHLGNLAIEQGTMGDSELKARVIEKFGHDPDFTEYSSNLGSKFAEHGSIKVSQVPTPGDIQTQITEIMQRPAYMSSDKKVRGPLIDQVMALRNQLNKSKGIT